MKNSKQPAFPHATDDPNLNGLTKREYFALHLMQGLLYGADRHSESGVCASWNYEDISKISIKATDALLKELEK